MIEYVHDPLGRRIAKKVNGVITEKYLWQGLTRLLAVYDGNNALLMRFEYADSRMPAAMTAGGATYYLAYDQIGTLKVVADAAGNVIKRVEYDSFGNIISDSNPACYVPFGFAGGLYDPDTGLVRFGYRDYDPDTGRWTAKDPIFFAGGDTDLYGYCVNDPINLTDPFGLKEHYIFEFDLPSLLFEIYHYKKHLEEEFEHQAKTDPELREYWKELLDNYEWVDAVFDWFSYDVNEAVERYRKGFEYDKWRKEYYENLKKNCK